MFGGAGTNSLAFLLLIPELGLLLLSWLHPGCACVPRSELDLPRPRGEDEGGLHPLPPHPDSVCPRQQQAVRAGEDPS